MAKPSATQRGATAKDFQRHKEDEDGTPCKALLRKKWGNGNSDMLRTVGSATEYPLKPLFSLRSDYLQTTPAIYTADFAHSRGRNCAFSWWKMITHLGKRC